MLTAQRDALTRDNQLRRRVRDFASRVLAVIDTLDFDQKQTLLRLVVEEVHVTGWHVQIRLRIPLDDNPDGPPRPPNPDPGPDRPGPVSTEDRLRSLGSRQAAVPPQDGGRSDPATGRFMDSDQPIDGLAASAQHLSTPRASRRCSDASTRRWNLRTKARLQIPQHALC